MNKQVAAAHISALTAGHVLNDDDLAAIAVLCKTTEIPPDQRRCYNCAHQGRECTSGSETETKCMSMGGYGEASQWRQKCS
jgi:hypothetical protein